MGAPGRPANSTASAATSASLLDGLERDEPQAWDRLVRLYSPLIYFWCRKLGLAEQDMADVFQEIFQAVAANVGRLRRDRPGDTFRGWLRTVTRSKVFDHFRRQTRQPRAAGGTEAQLRLAQLPEDEPPDAPADDARLSDDDACRQVFQHALELIRDQFQERTWQAFWRVVVEGKSPQEVGQELAMRPGTVRVAKSRVLHRLRQELGEEPGAGGDVP